MRKTNLTVIAACAILLWAGTVLAGNPKLAMCQASLSQTNANLLTCNSNLATAQLCGNDIIDTGEHCDENNLNGETCLSQGFAGGTLKCGAGCAFDTTACVTQRFTDNGDGTVTDNKTGLMWEQKSGAGAGDVHDVGNTYFWSTGYPGYLPNGTAFTVFLATLNDGTSDGGPLSAPTGCFANHCDWRLPSLPELVAIVDYTSGACNGGSGACIDPTFGPTSTSAYYSATGDGDLPYGYINAWCKAFAYGGVGGCTKSYSTVVRAVRSGP